MHTFSLSGEYMDYVEKIQNRKIVLFGAGRNIFSDICNYYPFGEVTAIWDNNPAKSGITILGIPVTTPPEQPLPDTDDLVVVITLGDEIAIGAITRQLRRLGVRHVYSRIIFNIMNKNERYNNDFSKKFHELNTFNAFRDNIHKIQKVKGLLFDEKSRLVYDAVATKKQYNIGIYNEISENPYDAYFSEGFFEYEDREIFVDGGAYHGEDTIRFAELVGDKFARSYCFEPDPVNHLACAAHLGGYFGARAQPNSETQICSRTEKFILFKAGLYDENQNVAFTSYGNHGSAFSFSRNDHGGAPVAAVRLDDVVEAGDKITMIKLDVEGAEMATLRGAARIIGRDRPKLALSIYHLVDDLWEIPLYVHSLVPEYKLYVRHHFPAVWGTVLYATM